MARIQLLRTLEQRQARQTRLEIAAGALVALLVLAALAGVVLAILRAFDMSYAALVGTSLLIAWAVSTIAVGAGIVLLVMFALGVAGMAMVPGYARAHLAGWTRRRRELREREECEAVLARTGELVDPDRRTLLRSIARADATLRYDDTRHAVTVALEGPPETCPRCRGALAHPSPGLRRCAFCAFERFDEPAARAEELVAARTLIDKVLHGEVFTGDRAALWKRFKASTRREEPSLIVGMLAGGVVFALLGDLGRLVGWGWLLSLGRLGVFFLAVGAGVMLPVALYALYARRFRLFGPGYANYDRAVAVDIVTTLAQQGVMTRPALAAHLGITPAHLEETLARLHALGVPAAYHDVRNDRLVSLHARTDLTACPACGGQLEAGELARLACRHCGGTVATR